MKGGGCGGRWIRGLGASGDDADCDSEIGSSCEDDEGVLSFSFRRGDDISVSVDRAGFRRVMKMRMKMKRMALRRSHDIIEEGGLVMPWCSEDPERTGIVLDR